jgi:hypothetical protein
MVYLNNMVPGCEEEEEDEETLIELASIDHSMKDAFPLCEVVRNE